MRTLSDSLKNAQQATSIDALVKIVLTKSGETTRTYTRDHILDKNHPEEPYSQRATVVLDNSNGALTNLALQGFKGVISYGAITSAGEEYSACAPLWVISQQLESSPGKLDCTLELIGIMNLMAEDKASASYMPDEDDTKTVKTLINEILGATLACFNHCQSYQVVWEAGYDSLADTYKPKDSFRIYAPQGTRLAAFRRLLDYTGNVARAEADGKVHIFKPTTTGVVYDSEYSLESGHTFFGKAYRKRVVIPGYIVVKSQPYDDPQYSGYAKDPGYDGLPAELKKRDYKLMRLESNQQAKDIAEAILSKHQLWSEMGAADVPINVGAEVFDYVKVAAFCAEDVFRVGNIGHLARHYNAERAEWRMPFSFGNWMTVRKALAGLGVLDPDELSEYFSRLTVKDAYIEDLLVERIRAVWLDPDGNIDASKLPEFLDNIPDGEYNATVKRMHLDATGLTFESSTIYTLRLPGKAAVKVWKGTTPQDNPDESDLWIDTNYTPNKVKRWNGSAWQELPAEDVADLEKGIFIREVKSSSLTADGLVFLKELDDSGDYKRTKSAALTADGLVLLDQVVEGEHGLVLKNDISGGHVKGSALIQSSGYRLVDDGQIADWDEAYEVALEAYDLGIDLQADIVAGYLTLSEHTNINGEWYKTGGVRIHASEGILIYGSDRAFVTRASRYGTDQCYVGSDGSIRAGAGSVRLDEDGLHIRGTASLEFSYSGSHKAWILVNAMGHLQLSPAAGYNLVIGEDTFVDNLRTFAHEQGNIGYSTEAWRYVIAKYLYSDSGGVSSYQGHDDIALIKAIGSRKDREGKDVLDGRTLPAELTLPGARGQRYINVAGLHGLSIGAMKQIIDRLEALEARVGGA